MAMENAGINAGMSHGNRKLVVLGIPWEVDTEGLKKYMSQYGPLDDVIVMKDRATGHSRGFGYATFSSPDDAKKVAAMEHSLSGRVLEVKFATPKEEMSKTPKKKITRIFVARIPPSITDETFRRYFEKYGTITDAFMPKNSGAKGHRGIGFVTFENPDSVDKVMAEKHELAGSTIAVDRATPKEESSRPVERSAPSSYSPYGIYTTASNYGVGAIGRSTFGAAKFEPSLYGGYESRTLNFEDDLGPAGLGSGFRIGGAWSPPPTVGFMGGAGRFGGPAANVPITYGSNFPTSPPSRRGVKVFVGRLPSEATAEDLRRYFNTFGRILDVFIPKGSTKNSHRGFGFVTFADEGAAERVTRRPHEILGVEVAVDRAEPPSNANGKDNFLDTLAPSATFSDVGGPIRSNPIREGPKYDFYGGTELNEGWRTYGGVAPISRVDGALPGLYRSSRIEARYRPY